MSKKSASAAGARNADARRLTALEQKIKREPDAIDAYLEMAALMSRRRAPDMAAQLLRTALDRAPRHLGLLTNLGGLLAGTSYTAEEGIGYLRQVVEQMPRSYLSHYNLAIGLKSAGQFAESATQFRLTLDLKPAFADALALFRPRGRLRPRPGPQPLAGGAHCLVQLVARLSDA